MKKISENFKTITLAIVLLFSSANIFANEIKPTVEIISAENKVFALLVNDAKLTDLTIRITELNGAILLAENISINNRHSKSYDLSNLPMGTYEVELEDDISFRTQLIKVTATGLEISEKKNSKIFKPVVQLDGQNALFNMMNGEKNSVKISILNQNGEVLFSENVKDAQTIHRSYDLSNLENGTYRFRIYAQGKVFDNKVELSK